MPCGPVSPIGPVFPRAPRTPCLPRSMTPHTGPSPESYLTQVTAGFPPPVPPASATDARGEASAHGRPASAVAARHAPATAAPRMRYLVFIEPPGLGRGPMPQLGLATPPFRGHCAPISRPTGPYL